MELIQSNWFPLIMGCWCLKYCFACKYFSKLFFRGLITLSTWVRMQFVYLAKMDGFLLLVSFFTKKLAKIPLRNSTIYRSSGTIEWVLYFHYSPRTPSAITTIRHWKKCGQLSQNMKRRTVIYRHQHLNLREFFTKGEPPYRFIWFVLSKTMLMLICS